MREVEIVIAIVTLIFIIFKETQSVAISGGRNKDVTLARLVSWDATACSRHQSFGGNILPPPSLSPETLESVCEYTLLY